MNAQLSKIKDLKKMDAVVDSCMAVSIKKSSGPLIGISAGHYNETNSSGAPNSYVNAVIKAGGIPIIIPIVDNVSLLCGILSRLDGILMTGGGDIDPSFYNQLPIQQMGEVDSVRDAYDLALIRIAAERNLPILGICRGEQLINVAFGGTLYQDLPSQHPSDIQHRQTEGRDVETHVVSILKKSRLYDILKVDTLFVNSFHHQAIRKVAADFYSVAWTRDNIVEAIESSVYKNIIAVQWHPEGLVNKDKKMLQLFKYFIRQARMYRKIKE